MCALFLVRNAAPACSSADADKRAADKRGKRVGCSHRGCPYHSAAGR